MSAVDTYLITGFSGFVSKHFLDYLETNQLTSKIIGIDINEPEFDFTNYKHIKCSFAKIDLLNKKDVNDILNRFKPQFILHLASYSSVAFSWKNPVESFTNNTNIFLNLIETIRTSKINCRVLSIGSSEEYGNVHENYLPLKENHKLDPVSPYAVARVSQEMLSKVYVESYGMDIILTRSFNHIGTHQKPLFVIPSFCLQLISLQKNESENKEIVTGDTSIIRDFVDVRDVVRAYYLLLQKGKKGTIYNVCSGIGTSLFDTIMLMANILDIKVSHKVNPNLVRPNDNKIIIGSNEKITSDTGWKPEYALSKSLEDILDFYKGIE